MIKKRDIVCAQSNHANFWPGKLKHRSNTVKKLVEQTVNFRNSQFFDQTDGILQFFSETRFVWFRLKHFYRRTKTSLDYCFQKKMTGRGAEWFKSLKIFQQFDQV